MTDVKRFEVETNAYGDVLLRDNKIGMLTPVEVVIAQVERIEPQEQKLSEMKRLLDEATYKIRMLHDKLAHKNQQPVDVVRSYKKKPVTIQAMLLTPDNMESVRAWCNGEIKDGQLSIPTKEGVMSATMGDYIIRGVVGEFYPCKPDIFNMNHEAPEALNGTILSIND